MKTKQETTGRSLALDVLHSIADQARRSGGRSPFTFYLTVGLLAGVLGAVFELRHFDHTFTFYVVSLFGLFAVIGAYGRQAISRSVMTELLKCRLSIVDWLGGEPNLAKGHHRLAMKRFEFDPVVTSVEHLMIVVTQVCVAILSVAMVLILNNNRIVEPNRELATGLKLLVGLAGVWGMLFAPTLTRRILERRAGAGQRWRRDSLRDECLRSAHSAWDRALADRNRNEPSVRAKGKGAGA